MGGLCLSKKKKSAREISRLLDPIERVDDRDLILQHLTGTEILQSTEVSSTWNRAIAESEVAMKKIRLYIIDCEEASKEKIIATILESPRQYQNLYVFSQKKRDVIVSLAESLVELTVKEYDVKIDGLVLHDLKKLEFDGDAMADGLMACASNLEELHIRSVKYAAVDSVLHCLQLNDKLKRLFLGASPCMIFNEDLSLAAFKFKLTELTAKLGFVSDPGNFFMFLRSQASSLQRLSIQFDTFDSRIFNVVVNNLVHLEELGVLSKSDAYLPNNLFLRPNRSLKHIKIQSLMLNDLTRLKSFLYGLPNLEILEVMDTTVPAFDLTVKTAKKLRVFRTVRITFQIFETQEEFNPKTLKL